MPAREALAALIEGRLASPVGRSELSDGASGIIKAIEVCCPRSTRQRCLAHRMRNLAVKVPEDLWPEFKARATADCQARSQDRPRGRRLDHDYQAAYRLDTGRSGDTPAARIPSRSRT